MKAELVSHRDKERLTMSPVSHFLCAFPNSVTSDRRLLPLFSHCGGEMQDQHGVILEAIVADL